MRRLFANFGYEPAERFNASSGHSRLLYYTDQKIKVDVFIGDFQQCHVLPLERRLSIHPITLPLADLLLTKLQVAKLSDKDVTDILALILDNKLSEDESGLNVLYLARFLAKDWGWWRTSTETLDRLNVELPRVGLDPVQKSTVQGRLHDLRHAIDAEPKSIPWRARSKVGDRWGWRVDPEEGRA